MALGLSGIYSFSLFVVGEGGGTVQLLKIYEKRLVLFEKFVFLFQHLLILAFDWFQLVGWRPIFMHASFDFLASDRFFNRLRLGAALFLVIVSTSCVGKTPGTFGTRTCLAWFVSWWSSSWGLLLPHFEAPLLPHPPFYCLDPTLGCRRTC